MNQDYEYSGLMAETWDLFRGDTSNWEDRFFFLQVIARNGQPVLDVGCGTGRLLLDYLSQGIDVDGVDVSADMLALCRARAQALGLQARLYQQSMEELDLPRRYQTIIVPSSSFQLLTEPRVAEAAMRRFYAHLLPGGVLSMPFMRIWPEGKPLETEWELNREIVRPEDGATVRRWSRARYDPESQLEHTEDRYEVRLGDQVLASEHHRRSPATRDYTWDQAMELFMDAGFGDLRLYGGFAFEPLTGDDSIVTVLGKKEG